MGSEIHYSKKWKTFYDFLADYIKKVFGTWGDIEIKKTFEERHIILQWYKHVCDYQKKTIENPDTVFSAPNIGFWTGVITKVR